MGGQTSCFPRCHFAPAGAERVSRLPLRPTGSSADSSIVQCPGSEVDLADCSKEELVHRLHREEAEKLAVIRVIQGMNWLIQGMNWQLQEYLHKICELKAVSGWLQAENHELHDLCCFLDEDWLKPKHLACHWQLFRHHMVQVLHDKVAGCLHKLAGLE
ncbi:Coiled-coil domain-containing protein 85B, partial [Ophiophagus hannah]